MYKTIDEYLEALKEALQAADPALLQDALADAREHLFTGLEVARNANPAFNEAETLQKLIEAYGTPEETAAAYREVERRTSPGLKQAAKPRSLFGRFFGVYADPRAWGGLLYMFIAFITGIFYFTWAVTGLSLSISLSIFIFGLPLALLFLLSVRGLALVEGRLVEALLGVRMPRRPLFSHPDMKWVDRLKALVLDRQTWLFILYMLLQLPLGILYFTILTIALALSLTFISLPVLQAIMKMPLISMGETLYYVPGWAQPFIVAWGLCLWTAIMHLVKFIGQLHGRFAKWMLV
jgi:hypothetical protein